MRKKKQKVDGEEERKKHRSWQEKEAEKEGEKLGGHLDVEAWWFILQILRLSSHVSQVRTPLYPPHRDLRKFFTRSCLWRFGVKLQYRIRAVSGAPLRVTGQNGSGQNGTDKMIWTKWYTDKMVWTKWYTDKMALDKMVWTKWYGQNGTRTKWHRTKWYGQNGTDKMVQFYIF